MVIMKHFHLNYVGVFLFFCVCKIKTHLFLQNVETGKYEFRYIFVEIDTYPRRTIVVEDNR